MSDAMWRQARDKAYLGQGLAWPLQVDSRGGLALAHGERDLEQAIQIILETAPGERVMRPEFGCRANEMLFEPRNSATETRMQQYVEQALRRWEPRIEVQEVNVFADEALDGALMVEINYIIGATHNERSIVYPFFLVGEEEW
jgi:phage baseplate assembly protein W